MIVEVSTEDWQDEERFARTVVVSSMIPRRLTEGSITRRGRIRTRVGSSVCTGELGEPSVETGRGENG